jgi:lysophospholipase L1-like esterase
MSKYAIMLLGVGVLCIIVFIFLVTTKHDKQPRTIDKSIDQSHAITYLPLGDSYTIGQSVPKNERWPNQLILQLAKHNITMRIVANPSVTGYTTQDLIDTELPLITHYHPQFATVLIGVNDYIQGVPIATFQKNLVYIISFLKQHMSQPQQIMLITIPDYAETPTGAQFGNPQTATSAIEAFNSVIVSVGQTYAIPVANIFPISQQVSGTTDYIASDGLHPSGKQYALWTNIISQTFLQNSLF